MKVFIHLVLLSIILSFINSLNNLSFKLEKGEDLCLSEYFSDKTLVIYTITSDYNIHVRISDSDEKVKADKVHFINTIKNINYLYF